MQEFVRSGNEGQTQHPAPKATISKDCKSHSIPEHAQAFVSVLRLAADRIERGEGVQDVVRGMALHNVVLALSGLV